MGNKEFYAKCGNVCSRCPSFKINLRTMKDRSECSEGWEKYLGFKLKPEKLRACDGCQYPDDKNPIRYINCKTRKCAVYNDVLTCAHCSAFPCRDLPAEFVSRIQIEKKIGVRIPDKDYEKFVEPYEGRKFLDEIRLSLSSEEIKQMKEVSFIPRIEDFPENLSLPEQVLKLYKDLHTLLARIGTAEGVTYARQEALKKKRKYLLKLLWAFGSFGEFKEQQYLVMDAQTYIDQKIHSSLSVLNNLCVELEEYGLHCEHFPLEEEGWQTPTGSLRPKGWQLRMTYDLHRGGVSALKALKTYVERLNKEYGEKAYRYFSMADMSVLV